MNSRDAALKSALSLLARPGRRADRPRTRSRRKDAGELVLAELQGRRKRLGKLLRLLGKELRRNGDAARPSGERAKTVQRSGR